jgi:hypothetical protein
MQANSHCLYAIKVPASKALRRQRHQILLLEHCVPIQVLDQLRILGPKAFQNTPILNVHELLIEVSPQLQLTLSFSIDEFSIETTADTECARKKPSELNQIKATTASDQVVSHFRPQNHVIAGIVFLRQL